MTEQTADSLLMGGASFFSWAQKNPLGQYVTKPYGTKIAGTVATIGELNQQTDWDTGALLTWPDGKPKMQFAITLDVDWQNCQIGLEDVPSDNTDTQRSVMVKQSSQLQAALRDAIKAAGSKGLQVGAYVTFTLTGEQPSGKGNPLKVYAIEYRPPAQGIVMDGGQQQPQAQSAQIAGNVMPQQPMQQAAQGAPPAQVPAQPQQQPAQAQAQQPYPAQVQQQPVQQPQQAPQAPAQQVSQQDPWAQASQAVQAPQPQQQQAQQVPQQQDPTAIAKQLYHQLKLPAQQVAASTGLTVEQVEALPPF